MVPHRSISIVLEALDTNLGLLRTHWGPFNLLELPFQAGVRFSSFSGKELWLSSFIPSGPGMRKSCATMTIRSRRSVTLAAYSFAQEVGLGLGLGFGLRLGLALTVVAILSRVAMTSCSWLRRLAASRSSSSCRCHMFNQGFRGLNIQTNEPSPPCGPRPMPAPAPEFRQTLQSAPQRCGRDRPWLERVRLRVRVAGQGQGQDSP